MKTIPQFAKEQGVTTKTIYQRLRKVSPEGLQGDTRGLTEVINKTRYITALGESLVTEGDTRVSPGLQEGDTEVTPGLQDEIDYLRSELTAAREELNAEREHSRSQADKLAVLATQLAEITHNNQLLLGAEQSRTNPALLPEENKPGFFSRIFKSRK